MRASHAGRLVTLSLVALAAAPGAPLHAQQSDTASIPVTVDDHGVMRWTATGKEVALWGVNYTVPFAYAYRALGYVGVDRKQAIDADVLHFARLGLDAYRIHVWDREVSDTLGNLVANDHLDLLDYLLARLAEHGIKAILTPIAWWPTGYPEPDPVTHGLSDRFRDKGEMTSRVDGWPAQENYLRQFITHRNPYTGLTYADDPNLIAIEIVNEPNHPARVPSGETTRYINTMAAALRGAGFRKPILYNISEGPSDRHAREVCAANIQGVTHQWYPTGLVHNSAVGGNMLPNVDRYPIPYADYAGCQNKARIVYEFDAADVAGSYMYPAMARSFRAAGFQWATQFAYDPLAIAYSNTEYQTHFLNLVYTPSKAVSFMIAGAAFRALPRGGDYGVYPASARFGPFRVSYVDDLSEMVTDTAFYYSNSTSTAPPATDALRHVAGVGSSPVIQYDGTGAYFLDRLGDGLWRLEVYPDVAWVVDPFTRPSLDREAARVFWRTRSLKLTLPDLGTAFTAEPLNAGNDHRPTVHAGAFDVRPGVYLLARAGVARPAWTADSVIGGRRLGAFVAPPSSKAPLAVVHTPPRELRGLALVLRVEVASRNPVDSVVAFVRRAGTGYFNRKRMKPVGGFIYQAAVAIGIMGPGLAEYAVAVYDGPAVRTFPGGTKGDPRRWDFPGREFWRVPVVDPQAPLALFDAACDLDHVLYPTRGAHADIVPGSEPGRLALSLVVSSLTPRTPFQIRTTLPDEDWIKFAPHSTRPPPAPRPPGFGTPAVLRIRARLPQGVFTSDDSLEVALVERDGTAWGAAVKLGGDWQEFTIPIEDLRRTPLALLPGAYPRYLPSVLQADVPDAPGASPSFGGLDGLQFTLRTSRYPHSDVSFPHGFEIERVILERVIRWQ